jgi:predicted O-methyltransferase YrrM
VDFEAVAAAVDGVPQPHISHHQARSLYDHIRETAPEEALELGTAHGVSGSYIAAALAANGGGHLTTVDSSAFPWSNPTPDELLGSLGLLDRVTLDRTHSTYTWLLKEQIEARSDEHGNCKPLYDFCFIDGGKSWTTDGLAVFLVEKLLRPGGWLLLDDLDWTFRAREARMHYWTALPNLSEPELREPHMRKVFDLIVRQHPAFGEFKIQDGTWGWARKVASPDRRLTFEETRPLRSYLAGGARMVRRALAERLRR